MVNPNVGGWKLSPFASELEAQTVRWIAELIGYPTNAGGLLVSGGNMANFIGFLAARTAKASWDVRKTGLAGGDAPLRLYASRETHTWIQKAADLSGLGTDAIRWVRPMINSDSIQRRSGSRSNPTAPPARYRSWSSAQPGRSAPEPWTRSQRSQRSVELDVWFHVDGAYGAAAAQVEGAPAELSGLSHGDSDPHKWLYAPLEAGCVLVRDADHLRGAFSYHPTYYHMENEGINYFDVGRGFRALKVWLALQQRVHADDCR